MNRKNISSGTPWEPIVGYSRAVCVRTSAGTHVWVAGTTASNEAGEVQHVGDAGAQAGYILKKIERALEEAGATMQHVVRTRVFVTDIGQWKAVGRAHGEVFADIRPASTMVEISKLIDPQQLVEIEVDAFVA
jgi:enamine deaminase RidA (YjgF/YER057c/UK114 family)